MKNATRTLIGTFGTLAGVAGMEHGIGEILQGDVPPAGIMILSWPDSPFFRILGGEPAMTLVPSLLWSGVLSVAVSLLMVAWALRFVHRPFGGLGLIVIAFVLLLVGGGFGPPLLATVLGISAMRLRSQHHWTEWVPRLRDFLARAFPLVLGATLAAWLGLLLGVPALNYLMGIDSVALVLVTIVAAFGLLGLSVASGYAHDAVSYRSTT